MFVYNLYTQIKGTHGYRLQYFYNIYFILSEIDN